MKRGMRYIFGAMALLLLNVACTKSELLDEGLEMESSEGVVQFGMFADYDSYFGTRATIVTSDEQAGTMGVFGYYLASGTWAASSADAEAWASYFDNTIVSYGGGAWSYENARYWPVIDGSSISFFAYSPHSSSAEGITATSAVGAAPTINYVIPADPDDQVDLMVAAVLDASAPNDGENLQLPMKHMLSTIKIVASDYTDIESVIISGTAYEEGTIIFNTDGTPEWSALETNTSFSHNFELLDDSDDSSVALLMMIPMEVEEDALSVTITYSYNGTYEYIHEATIPATTWEAGVSYTYDYTTLDTSLNIDVSETGLDADDVIRRIEVAAAYGESIDITLWGAYDNETDNTEINTYLKAIADYCEGANEDFTLDLTDLEGLTSITGGNAAANATFYDNDNLVGIILPEDLEEIGTYSFYSCSSLEYVIFPEGISESYSDIGTATFYGCTSLEAIYFPASVVSVKSNVFYGCTNLEVISIPGVTEFSGTRMFYGCSSLETLFLSTDATFDQINFAALKASTAAGNYTNTFSCDLYTSSTNSSVSLSQRSGVTTVEYSFSLSGSTATILYYTNDSGSTDSSNYTYYTGYITFASINSVGSGLTYAYEESDYADPSPSNKYGDPKDPWMVTGYYNTSGTLVSFISNNSVSY